MNTKISPHKMEAQRTLGTSASDIVEAMNMNNIARVQTSLYAPDGVCGERRYSPTHL
jgi:hypothetical protein